MINKDDLTSEKKYLNGVVDTIEKNLEKVNNQVYCGEKSLQQLSRYMSDSFYDMDDEEKATSQIFLENMQTDLINLSKQKDLLEAQKQNAYFGRVDFKENKSNQVFAYYIGISHVLKENFPIPLVLDWRAPLSSIYYDFELGKASYTAPDGKISGNIYLKRQYKVAKRELIYAFDSNLTIGDEILKETLNNTTDIKMKNIVATIQTEQNQIIRAKDNNNLLVQGVAGSGKTSIALHRVAYLLYKNKISSNDILIISPSSLFSTYISDVLPELGEQNTPKLTFEEIAKEELDGFVDFEKRSQMLEDLLCGNQKRAEEVKYKSSFEFLENLKIYLKQVSDLTFNPTDFKYDKQTISSTLIKKLYNENYSTKTPAIRLEWIADYIVDLLELPKEDEKIIFQRIKKMLFNSYENTNILSIYANFLSAIGLKITFAKDNTLTVRYEDIPAILYIKNFFIGLEVHKYYKHIVIDEMQDYDPVTFEIFNIIFPETKTILGDIYQSFEKILDHKYLDKLAKLIGNTKITKLAKTYRSTLQIAEYNKKIINLQNVTNFNREGNKVITKKITTKFEDNLLSDLKNFSKKYKKIAVITPTILESQNLYAQIKDKISIDLIDDNCGEVISQLNIIPAVLTKGLEFDVVLFVDNKKLPQNYLSKNLKYISCTRALQQLIIYEK